MASYLPNSSPLDEQDILQILEVIKSGKISIYNSDIIKAYEKLFAFRSGAKHAIATNTGTAALHTILAAINISSEDEVLISGLNYISDIYAILYLGAKPVILDIENDTLKPSIKEIHEKVSNKTKAIILTGNFGLPTDALKLKREFSKKKILIIEDLSQCFGGEFKGRAYGIKGDIAFYSTSSTKNLTTGEGGVIATDNDTLAEKCKILINLGQVYKSNKKPVYPEFCFKKKIDHTEIGFTYRLSPILASIGISQLKKSNLACVKRRIISEQYKNIVSKFSFLRCPNYNCQFSPCFNEFPILLDLDVKVIKKIKQSFNKNRLPIYPSYYAEIPDYSIGSRPSN